MNWNLYYFKVRNFGVLDDVCLSLDKFNLLIGKNMTGKTTFIESINYLVEMIFKSNEPIDSFEYIYFSIQENREISYKLKFKINKDSIEHNYIYCTTILNNQIVKESLEKIIDPSDESKNELWVSKSDNKIRYQCFDSEKNKYISQEREVDRKSSFLHLLWDSKREPYVQDIRNFFISLVYFEPVINVATTFSIKKIPYFRSVQRNFDPLEVLLHTIKDKDASIIQSLESNIKLIFDNVDSIQLDHQSDKPIVKINESLKDNLGNIIEIQSFNLREMSDGFIRTMMILLFALLAEKNSRLLVIDEIDVGLNPTTLHALIDILCNIDTQIIITSHRYEVLDWCNSLKVFIFLRKSKYAQVHVGMTEEELKTYLGVEYKNVSRFEYINSGDESHIIRDYLKNTDDLF
jgi:predicted ATPase